MGTWPAFPVNAEDKENTMDGSGRRKMAAVTGCDSGIGYGLVDELLDRGYEVIAAYLKDPPHKPHANLVCWKMDLRKAGDTIRYATLVNKMSAGGSRLHVLIHNAGMVLAAPVEDMPMRRLREVFEVNFFGLYELTQLLIPTLIKDRSRVILNASLAGRIALPFFSPYVASKFAVEGFGDCLRQELAPFGVRVSILDPGAVATPIWNESWNRIERELAPLIGDRWKSVFVDGAREFVKGGNAGLPVARAVKRIADIAEASKPKPRYFIGKHPFIDQLKTMIPTRLRDVAIRKMLRLDQLG